MQSCALNHTHRDGSADDAPPPIGDRLFSVNTPPSLEGFKQLTVESRATSYPLSTAIKQHVPIYNLPEYSTLTNEQRATLQDEWYHILLHGPGVFITKNLYKNTELFQRVDEVFAGNAKRGDHFASSGANDRIWNSFQKHCLQDPQFFLTYYSNPWLPLISSAWLGPHHRLTAQVNIVKPGAKAQMSHRDYHLGFQDAESVQLRNSDMPVESGPTRLLPFSQRFEAGYMAYRLPEFQQYFLERYVSMPLELGDGIFFNPALFHAAGQNNSESILRSANLLQISAAFAKPMEAIDSFALVENTWTGLQGMYKQDGLSDEVKAVVGHVAEGYPFPTNLDVGVPETAGMAPESE
ncbi:hypothetical protein DM02DRAFT_676874 [Periconia macrospinosa]|uniref:Phytanoyl-CoA dioxygenase-like protein n=1 Tax=Periconia macrospinosa TaxID=97972 RepID=A0A2V1D8B4_9PLEO|nr:hypothetical protein DM02DRAFT_676874 [Periconia macrospinosa]